jgi:hypothetical protein
MYGRIDDAKFQNGAASIENMIATALGPTEKRPGFSFVATTKNNGPARLIPFTYSTTQTMVIEIGPGYFRFHTQGQTLQAGSPNAWLGTGGSVTVSPASPSLVTLANHGLSTGDPVRFFIPPGTPSANFPPWLTEYVTYYITVVDANTFTLSATAGGDQIPGSGSTAYTIFCYPFYTYGNLVTYNGSVYCCIAADTFGAIPNWAQYWYPLRSSCYEIPNNYAAADLMNIHFVQSADVMTLVHPNYAPSELSRLGATQWKFAPIVFGQTLSAPTGVAVTPTLGYKAVISSITAGNNGALITTVANHSLAMGDGVYVQNGTNTGNFLMVSSVPSDSNGNLIDNELYLMDYSGNPVESGDTRIAVDDTMQYGTQIVDITRTYVVTAMASDGIQQSAISAEVSVLNNLYVTGSYNTLAWDAVPGAYTYYIYKKENGLYGYIGDTPSLTFADTNIAPDMSITPDICDPVFGSSNDYPGAVSYYQQRRIFGGTANNPQNLWLTKTGTESDMSYSLPIQDTDRIAIAIATREMSTILHAVPLLQLILLTSSCEISASPTSSDTITPSTICARPQSYIGASNVSPSVVNNAMIFCAARGGHVREMGYQWQIGGYVTGDVSLRAAHLFDGFSIVDQAFMKSPWQTVWFVSSSGNLIGFTYIPEEQVGAWHHHTTAGAFQSIAVVAEGAEDHLYAIITRQINGATVNCIERMGSRLYGASQNAFYVDCGATFDGTNTTATTMTVSGGSTWGPADTLTVTASADAFANTDPGSVIVFTGSDGVTLYRFTIQAYTSPTVVTGVVDKVLEADLQGAPAASWAWARPTIAGLTWLVGQTVSVLVDGAVQPQCVVSAAGQITLQRPGVVVQVGLPYTAEIDTLPIALQVDGSGQGRQKNVNKVWIKVYVSGSVFAGPTGGTLTEYKQRTTEAFGAPPAPMTKEIEIVIQPSWGPDGTLTISQSNPLPLTLVGLTAEVAIGG